MSKYENRIWREAIGAAADPKRVRHYLTSLAATPLGSRLAAWTPGQVNILAALFSGSPAMSDLLVAHPEWFEETVSEKALEFPRRDQGLRREVQDSFHPALERRDEARALAELRQFKQRQMLRIAARDLSRRSNASEVTRELSDVADVCLSAVLALCLQQQRERLGQPYFLDAHERWQPAAMAVIGLGKLGGQELNYSSDVDLMFVYSEEGHVFKEPPRRQVDPEKALSSHAFFKRVAEAFVAEVTRPAPEGMLYRVDLRLRPEGDAGPLVRSLPSYENFYAQWGQIWERMMLIKARGVAGDAALAAEFIEVVQPFRYPRSLARATPQEIAAMKRRLEQEVVRSGEMERNIKLGRGGIREIEFVAQSLQLLHGGRQPFLQGGQTLPALQKLVQYNLLPAREAGELDAAYSFLRDLEHRLQMEHNLQTHTVPAEAAACERLGRLLGFGGRAAFQKRLRAHQANVRRVYEQVFPAENDQAPSLFPEQLQGHDAAWKTFLAGHRFRDPEKALRLLTEFVHGPGYVHVSPRTSELAGRLLPRIFALCPQPPAKDQPEAATLRASATAPPSRSMPGPVKFMVLSDPDRVLARLDTYVSAYGARAMLVEMWTHHSSLFDLLLLLFDRSEFLAETAIRTPDMIDELVLSGRLNRAKAATETLEDLRHGHQDADQHLWLRRYHQTELMRIGLRDIFGLADFEQNLLELTALAEACLQYALEVVLRQRRLKRAPLAIIGLGKLGGRELNYGSDLDVVFVAPPETRNLAGLQKIAVEVLELLSARTEQGIVFATDARLRPDGEKGLLVNTLEAYEQYYRQRAQLWEIQALTRARAIAGDPEVSAQFQTLAAVLTNFTSANVAAGFALRQTATPASRGRAGSKARLTGAAGHGLSAYTPDWKQRIAQMRQRIEKERTPVGQEALAFKTGAGGLIDAEFIAQTLCLEHGWQQPGTLEVLERALGLKALPAETGGPLIENYRKLCRVEGILRRWSYEGEAVLPVDPAPYYRVSVRCGFPTPEAFREAMAGYRAAVRAAYRGVFHQPQGCA